MNFEKYSIHFSKNVPWDDKQFIVDLLGLNECDHRSSYLGFPFCKGKSYANIFKGIMEKVQNKLSR